MVTGGCLKGHHALSVLRSLNGSGKMDKKARMKDKTILPSGQAEIKGWMTVVLFTASRLYFHHIVKQEWRKGRKAEVGVPLYKPVLEEGVISDVSQPCLSYHLSQFIMVSCWQHSHQNFIGRQWFICIKNRKMGGGKHTHNRLSRLQNLTNIPQWLISGRSSDRT